jgi:hypothetical protein
MAILLRARGAIMLAKCSNPLCSAKFLHLKEGRLFRLESDPALHSSESDRLEYFWLCPHCSPMMALRLSEDGTVVTVLLPERIRGVPGDVAFTSQHRGKGLLLRSVSSPPTERLGGHVTARLKGGR